MQVQVCKYSQRANHLSTWLAGVRCLSSLFTRSRVWCDRSWCGISCKYRCNDLTRETFQCRLVFHVPHWEKKEKGVYIPLVNVRGGPLAPSAVGASVPSACLLGAPEHMRCSLNEACAARSAQRACVQHRMKAMPRPRPTPMRPDGSKQQAASSKSRLNVAMATAAQRQTSTSRREINPRVGWL